MFRKRRIEQLVTEGMQAFEYFTWVDARMAEGSREAALSSPEMFTRWQAYAKERDSYDQTKPTNQ